MSGEDDFIARHFASWAGAAGLGLRDDAALISPPSGYDLVVTTDAIVAGVHFLPDDPSGDIARKALRVNLSDLAAKGADPLGFLLTLALPQDFADAAIADFVQALRQDASDYACPLIGGDTVSTPGPLTISITAFGTVPTARMVRRGGAQDGDAIYVSGTIGDAALGLLAAKGDPRVAGLRGDSREALVYRYRRPQPRNALARAVREHATAAMDVSDGLIGDLEKMLSLAGLSARIAVADVPLSPAVAAWRENSPLLEIALTGGDDYEILCTLPKARCAQFEAAARKASVAVSRIGSAVREDAPHVIFTDENGRAMKPSRKSYSHV